MQLKIDKKQPKLGRVQPALKDIILIMKGEVFMNLSENLKKIRKENHLSQEELAEKLGVSRQSVSKWESGGAYPEMDKMVQLCNLFNLNIDDLLNQDIGEINNTKQAKSSVNKFIYDFLNYLTKTINMLSSMKFKNKIKCIFEQCLIIGTIAFILFIISQVLESLINPLFSFLPSNIYYFVVYILNFIYGITCIIVATIIVSHLFKIRYLDYFENSEVENNVISEEKNEIDLNKENNHKSYLKEKKEKVIIRDPEHSGYKFINSLVKIFMFFVKCFAFMFGLLFCISMIAFLVGFVLSFIFIKTGLMFFGLITVLISCIAVNYVILNILYNFIFTHKSKKIRLAFVFLISLIICGIGIGLISICATKFNIVSYEDNAYISKETTIKMSDDIILDFHFGELEYVESDNEDVRIVTKTTKFNEVNFEKNKNTYTYYTYLSDLDAFEILKNVIKDINDKKIVLYENSKIIIYTNKSNIDKIKNNLNNYYENEQYKYYEDRISEYENRIFELEEEKNDLKNQFYENE